MRLSIYLRAVCVLAIGLCVCSCNRSTVTGVEVDSKLKGFVLPKSKVLAAIDLDKLKKTGFYKRHQDQLALPKLDITEQVGMDPRRDLSYFLLAWDGSKMLDAARGTFSADAMEKRLKANSVATEKYNDSIFFGEGAYRVAVLPKGIALAGSEVVVKQAMNEGATGGNVIPEDLHLQLSRLNGGAQAWLVSSGVLPLDRISMRSDAATSLSNISDYINATAIGVTIDSGASLDAHISCISEEGSQRVHDALRGVIGLARLSTRDNDLDQLRIWDSMHVEKQGKEVHLTADLTPELADKLVAAIPGLARRF